MGRREHRHIDADFGDDDNSSQGIPIEARDRVNQVESGCERGDEAVDFVFDLRVVLFEFVDVVETLVELDGPLMGENVVYSGLNFGDWGVAALVKESDVICLPRVRQDMVGDGTRALTEHVREQIVRA